MAVGDVFKKRRNLVQQQSAAPAMQKAMNYYPGHPDYVPPKMTYQMQWRIANGQNPGNANFIYGVDDRDENGNPMKDNGMQLLSNKGPQSFNPQNQDVLARASAALDAVKQDRQQFPYNEARTLRPAQVRPLNQHTGDLPVEQPTNPMSPPVSGVPSINIWNNGRMQNSPRGGVYAEDPANDPNRGIYDLRDQIDALRERSQFKYPMVPNSPVQPFNPIAQGLQQSYDQTTRQGEIMFTPGATSSNGATRNFRNIAPEELNGVTAGTVNGYNGNLGYATNPMRLSPERKEQFAKANAQRIVGGGAATDPTNMRGRFGGAYGAGLDADAAAIASGTAVRLADGTVVRHTGTQDQARAAQLAGKAEREALRDRNNMNVPQAELDRRAAADAQKAARAAKHQAFKDANGGMSYRQYDRMTGSSSGNNALTMKAVREGRLSPEEANYRMQLRAEKALRRSGNPITGGTSVAGQLYPDQMAGQGGQNQNPAALANPIFGPVTNTPAGKMQAANNVGVMAATDPNIVALGIDPTAGLAGLHTSIAKQFDEDPTLELDDSSLKSYQQFAQQAIGADSNQLTPSTFTSLPGSVFAETEGTVVSNLWKELAELPDNPRARQQWLQKYKNRQKEIERLQTEYYGSYGS